MFHFPQYFPHRLRDNKGKLVGVLYCLWKCCLVFGDHGHNSQVRFAALMGRTRPVWNTHSCRWRRNFMNASNGWRTTGRGAWQQAACRWNSPNCIAQSTPPMSAFSMVSAAASPTPPMDLQDMLTVKYTLNGIFIIWRVISILNFPCLRWIFTSIRMLAASDTCTIGTHCLTVPRQLEKACCEIVALKPRCWSCGLMSAYGLPRLRKSMVKAIEFQW